MIMCRLKISPCRICERLALFHFEFPIKEPNWELHRILILRMVNQRIFDASFKFNRLSLLTKIYDLISNLSQGYIWFEMFAKI